MTTMTIWVPDDSVEFVERIGGNVEEREEDVKEKKPSKKGKSKKKKEKIGPTFRFGKWKDFDIDARKLREEAWGRKS